MDFATKQEGEYRSVPFSAGVIQTQGKCSITLQMKIDDNEFVDENVIPKNNTVTKIDMPSSVTMRLVSKMPFCYTIPGVAPRYMDKRKVEDYMYSITYGNIDYDYAYEYFSPAYSGGCSAVRNGNMFGRNFDWLYDNAVQFVVHTPTTFDRYAVIGVAGLVPGVVQSNVENPNIVIDGVDMFKLVPFHLLDGVNEKGVFCTHNIVPLDNEDDPTREIPAKKEERECVCVPMLPRFILDRFATADLAIEYLRDYVTLYFSDEMLDAGYQSHLLIGDAWKTYVVEFVGGEMIVKEANYITNFNIDGVDFDADGKVAYPPTEHGINKYGFGLERWDIITDEYQNCTTLDGMRDLLDKVMYSKCYADDAFWYSELVKAEDDDGETITVDTDPAVCTEAKAAAKQAYASRSRSNPSAWITPHSALYDIGSKRLYVRNQEHNTVWTFSV